MDKKAAIRIQSAVDKKGPIGDQGFKSRVMSTASKKK
jgi:hypothetical protein